MILILRGAKLDIYYASSDTEGTREDAVSSLNSANNPDAKMAGRLTTLADRGRLRFSDQMASESIGKGGTKIYAVKTTNGMRAYGFHLTIKGKRAFVISHFIAKKTQKLAKADLERAMNARLQIIDTWSESID